MAKKFHKEIQAAIKLHTDDYDIAQTKTHIKVTLRSNGRARKLTVSSSPSCKHAINQFQREVKKAVAEMDAGLEAGALWAKN